MRDLPTLDLLEAGDTPPDVEDLLARVRVEFERVMEEQKQNALARFDEVARPSVHTLISGYGLAIPVVVQMIGTPDRIWVTSNVDDTALTQRQLERGVRRLQRAIEAES